MHRGIDKSGGAAGFPGGLDRKAGGQCGGIKGFPGGAALFPQKEGLTTQLLQRFTRADAHLYTGLGPQVLKGIHITGKELGADGYGGPHPQRAHIVAAQKALFHPVHLLKQLPGLLLQALPGGERWLSVCCIGALREAGGSNAARNLSPGRSARCLCSADIWSRKTRWLWFEKRGAAFRQFVPGSCSFLYRIFIYYIIYGYHPMICTCR